MDSSGSLSPSSARELRRLAVRILTHAAGSQHLPQDRLRGFASGPAMGSSTRFRLHSLLAGVLRFRNTIDFLIGRSIRRDQRLPQSEARNVLRLAIYEARWLGVSMDRIWNLYSLDATARKTVARAAALDIEEVTHRLSDVEQTSIKLSHPTFLVTTFLQNLSNSEARSLMNANNEPRVHYLRLNRLKTTDLDIIEDLRGQGVSLERDKDVEGLFRVCRKTRSVVESEHFRNGTVILQDKASVIAAKTLDVRPGETVWDACAAPGMKTQLLWESMNREGRLVASDMSLHRLRSAISRGNLMGGRGIEWLQTDASRPAVSSADKILIDAPCTSTGTLRGNPSFKWSLNKASLLSRMSIQNKILDGIVGAYSDRPGTEIVYATCSLLPHEGESQIDSLVSRFDIKLLDAGRLGSTGYPGFGCSHAVRRFFPHRHDTNGFFICRFMT